MPRHLALALALSLALAPSATADDLKRHVYLTYAGDPTTSIVVNAHLVGSRTTLMPLGSTWKYFDGAKAPDGWAGETFDDAAWKSGKGPLGYGDRDIRTVLSFGPDRKNKRPACYFRRAFTLAQVPEDLVLEVVADDGAVIYVNGARVGAIRMPEEPTGWADGSASGDGKRGTRVQLDPRTLREGKNLLAVAVYQARADSSDLRFDAALRVSRGAPVGDVAVRWDTADREDPKTFRKRTKGVARPLPGLGDRGVAHVELTGLKPGARYRFTIGSDALGWSEVRMFRTIPRSGVKAEPLRFGCGGDMGTSERMAALLSNAAKRDVHFCIVGGDLAYANGRLENASRWDRWLDYWCARMVHEGRTIPMIAVIGNHEVSGYRGSPAKKAPWYYPLFADGQGGKSYFTRDFGPDLRMVFLDSGHTVTHAGQARFLTKSLEGAMKKRWRMAAYHIPLYPGHRNPVVGLPGRIFWQPIFDRYKLHAAYEHHDHTMKRTKPLKGGKVVESGGTVYLGDGCFGKRPRDAVERWYTARALTRAHVWVTTVAHARWTAEGIGVDDKVIDRYQSPERK